MQFDSFFVSVGLRDRPELRDKPIVVCHATGNAPPPSRSSTSSEAQSSTSEIASCNYVARSFDIRNGMSLGRARTLCPDVQAIPYDFKAYDDIAIQFYSILLQHSDAIEAVSVDEALIDVSFIMDDMRKGKQREGALYQKYQNYLSSQGQAWTVEKQFAEALRDEIRAETRTEASIGIGSNVLLARLATRKAKPGGSFHLEDELVPSFVRELDIDDLHGIGWNTKETCKDKFGSCSIAELLEKSSEAQFRVTFGPENGKIFWGKMNGRDRDKLVGSALRNSIGAAVNYAMRFKDQGEAEKFVMGLSTEVSNRMEQAKVVGKKLSANVMVRAKDAPVEAPKFLGHGVCDSFHKSTKLPRYTRAPDAIKKAAWLLIKSLNADPRELRGIGISLEDLSRTGADGSLLPPEPKGGQTLLSFGKVASGAKTAESPVPADKAVRFAGPAPAIAADPTSKEDIEAALQAGPAPAAALRKRSPSPSPPPASSSPPRAVIVEAPSSSLVPNETQYFLPSQVDESVLAELPASMRAKMLQAQEQRRVTRAVSEEVVAVQPPSQAAVPLHEATLSASQLDPEVMKALPESLRKEILRDLALASRLEPPQAERRRAATESPRKSKPIVSPDKGKLKKVLKPVPAGQSLLDQTTVQLMNPGAVSDADLLQLGIDASFYRALPAEIQRDLIRDQAAKQTSKSTRSHVGTGHRRVEELTRAERRAREAQQLAEADALIGQTIKPILQAKNEPLPVLRKATTVEGVRTFLSEWFAAYKNHGPREGDVAKLKAFLIANADNHNSTMDLDKVVALLQWWRYLLAKQWSEYEKTGADIEDTPAAKWWHAFQETLAEVNAVVSKQTGYPLNVA